MTTKSEKCLIEGELTADEAESVRQDLRWNVKPGTDDREALIDKTLEAIRVAMVPIRSLVGKAVWGKADVAEDKIQAVSDRLQYERKQLKKMKR